MGRCESTASLTLISARAISQPKAQAGERKYTAECSGSGLVVVSIRNGGSDHISQAAASRNAKYPYPHDTDLGCQRAHRLLMAFRPISSNRRIISDRLTPSRSANASISAVSSWLNRRPITGSRPPSKGRPRFFCDEVFFFGLTTIDPEADLWFNHKTGPMGRLQPPTSPKRQHGG